MNIRVGSWVFLINKNVIACMILKADLCYSWIDFFQILTQFAKALRWGFAYNNIYITHLQGAKVIAFTSFTGKCLRTESSNGFFPRIIRGPWNQHLINFSFFLLRMLLLKDSIFFKIPSQATLEFSDDVHAMRDCCEFSKLPVIWNFNWREWMAELERRSLS